MQSANGKAKGPRMIHEIKRMHSLRISRRKIARALGISRNTVDKHLAGADGQVVAPTPYAAPWSGDAEWPVVKAATERGVCLLHYWEESRWAVPGPTFVPYVSFWREFKRRFPSIPIDYHKDHPPAERCEVDFKGETRGLGYVDSVTGAFIPCRLFGAILCFSQYFFARVTPD